MQDRVTILPHTFILPNGDERTVEAPCPHTSRARADFYVKIKTARWQDSTHEAIYFLDPAANQRREDERKDGVRGWYVGDSGGSKLAKAYTGRTLGTRVLMCKGGEFEATKYDRSLR